MSFPANIYRWKRIKAAFRTGVASTRSSPGWERDLWMLRCREEDLPRAEEKGILPEGTLEYATEIIELKIRGKTVAKTRWQWASFDWGEGQRFGYSFPYRSYDSKKTRAMNTQAALIDLVSLNKANPDLSLDELKHLICKKYF